MTNETEGSSPIVCVVGRKDSGKTGVVVDLVTELLRRGHRVMTIKHGHGFALDTVGTDSWRHRHEGGAVRTVMAGPEGMAVMGEWGPEGEEDPWTLADRYLEDADIVVAEGYKEARLPRIEVHLSERHPRPIYTPDRPDATEFLALVTDSRELDWPLPILEMGAVGTSSRLADLVEDRLLEAGGRAPGATGVGSAWTGQGDPAVKGRRGRSDDYGDHKTATR